MVFFGWLFVEDYTVGFDPETGSFGFLFVSYWPYVVFGLGFLTGTVAYGSVAMALKFTSPLMLCTVLLFSPFIGQIYGVAMGLDNLPGYITWIGTFITIYGLY